MTLNKSDLENELKFVLSDIKWYDPQKKALNLPHNFSTKKKELKKIQPYVRALLAVATMHYLEKTDLNYYNKLNSCIHKLDSCIQRKKGNAHVDTKKEIKAIHLFYVANNILGLYK